ncbi:MAG TPA: FG-GAP-like repeat-containing protein [Candidatus Acidoferrum sp.]|nr:FG-GAP-like repeat-containing protein [Candidatus Acidoferrum sp.]
MDGFAPPLPLADPRFQPRYAEKGPLEDVLRRVAPGSDEFVTEKHAFEISRLLDVWSRDLLRGQPADAAASLFFGNEMLATSLKPQQERKLRGGAIEVVRRIFPQDLASARERFLQELREYFDILGHVETAEFQITGIRETGREPLQVAADIRYDIVGVRSDRTREERVGTWRTEWKQDAAGWRAQKWQATDEILSRGGGPMFLDVTAAAFGGLDSYRRQMLRGVDYWRSVLDGACGIDVYGNNGIAAGDFDGDGRDDLYVCQPSGLPNRLYHNRGDGTFEDVTERAGVGVLDGTACALFADFQNRGLQDLLVVRGTGPLLFVNRGDGTFALKEDAFRFLREPEGTFTHAAVADYDRDGQLDIYFCLYSYYVGLDQYHYPAPYFDARNGPPNFLLHNEGDWRFVDRTEAAGLDAENDRYSFACAWGDSSGDGAPDLFVANDFGRSNLYRNDGNGTFAAISDEARANDAGAGMSACWCDFGNSGSQDIYAANMWSAAGIRVSEQENFHPEDAEPVRALYRNHARGNALYRNDGNGTFANVSRECGAAMGRWAWSSDAWDFDNDGHSDLYIANGYISGPAASDAKQNDSADLASFFWRQVVGKSPLSNVSSPEYERGWNAINELIRSGAMWNGFERNVLLVNTGDGLFAEASGVAALDFADDSRAFALADLDGDGRLELVLKNRSGPQLRLLHNAMADIGDAIAFRLRGTKSNRDAIGSAITVETGTLRQTKYLQAGSGFLSQHTKEVFFGLGKPQGAVRATVLWPSGLRQTFEHLPVNHRVRIEEGAITFQSQPFEACPAIYRQKANNQASEPEAAGIATWLIEPLPAPEFSLPDLFGNLHSLRNLRGTPVLLCFWSAAAEASISQLRGFHNHAGALNTAGVQILAITVDGAEAAGQVRAIASTAAPSLPVLLATPDVAGVYNLVYRYLFDWRRDLRLPTSLLLNTEGNIVKVYQGECDPFRAAEDANRMPKTATERLARALPFPGKLYQEQFRRNDFTYGVAFFQHGYLEQAEASFKQVIAARPNDPEALYNLGTLYLRRNALADSQRLLERAVKLRPNYPEAWNNLGMIAAQERRSEEAVGYFNKSLELRPAYTTALVNLGNLYRREGDLANSQKMLERALAVSPNDPEVNYNLGMLYARQDQNDRAAQFLGRALALRPEYPDALNNLGVLLARQQRHADAEAKFRECISAAPDFDQAYLNLARLYALLQEKEKAKEVLKALLLRQPQHKMAREALERLN